MLDEHEYALKRRNYVGEMLTEQVMKRISLHRMEIAAALNKDWIAGLPGFRVYHAVYFMPDGEVRAGVLSQRRGVDGFQVGCVRDAGQGEAMELRSFSVTSIEAVIFLGLHAVDGPVTWELAL